MLTFSSFNSFRPSSAELQRRQHQLLQQQQAQRQSQMAHQRPAHSQPHQSLSSFYDTNAGIRGYKVIQEAQPMSHSLQQAPFKKTHYTIQDVTVPCVNMNPYSDSELLISIVDFNELLFPKLDFKDCVEHLKVLNIQQYIGNR